MVVPPSPPSQQVLITDSDTPLVVVGSQEVVEHSGGQTPHYCRQGSHGSHSHMEDVSLDWVAVISFHVSSSTQLIHWSVPSCWVVSVSGDSWLCVGTCNSTGGSLIWRCRTSGDNGPVIIIIFTCVILVRKQVHLNTTRTLSQTRFNNVQELFILLPTFIYLHWRWWQFGNSEIFFDKSWRYQERTNYDTEW